MEEDELVKTRDVVNIAYRLLGLENLDFISTLLVMLRLSFPHFTVIKVVFVSGLSVSISSSNCSSNTGLSKIVRKAEARPFCIRRKPAICAGIYFLSDGCIVT